jgi:hypothetical protein
LTDSLAAAGNQCLLADKFHLGIEIAIRQTYKNLPPRFEITSAARRRRLLHAETRYRIPKAIDVALRSVHLARLGMKI